MAEELLTSQPQPVPPAATGSPGSHGLAGVDGVTGLMARVGEHKIVQWALAYIGAAITIAHGEELLGRAFAWNEDIARWLLALLLVGFPIALTLAWYHGHKGLTRMSQGEMTIASILLVIAGLLLTVLVRTPLRSADAAEGPPRASPVRAIASALAPGPASAQASFNPRIAVLPFEGLSPDPNNAFFADGVHEEILTELTNHAPGLDVISSTTMSTYRGKAVAVHTLVHDLNCSYVLEGSVRREGNHVRLTLQLIDARNDRHVWAEDYDGKLVSAMALEREVAVTVTKQLSLRFAGPVEAEGLTSNPEAYDLYLKARTAESSALRAESPDGLKDARRLLDQAIAMDPKFVRAYLERMSLQLQQFLNNYSQAEEVLPQAQADLAAAQRLAPDDPVVTEFAGVMAYATQEYDRALQLFQTAEAAGIADPELLNWKDKLYFAMGRYREAAALSASRIPLASATRPMHAGRTSAT